MFKSGEVAKIKGTERTVVVKNGVHTDPAYKWPVETDAGVFEETDLEHAHPTVLATAEGRNLPDEEFLAKFEKHGDELCWETRDALQNAMKGMTVDFNGHWRNGEAFEDKENVLTGLRLSCRCFSEEDADRVLTAAKSGVPLDNWITVRGQASLTYARSCRYCGEDIGYLETNGVSVRIDEKPCSAPDGAPPTVWELNVPSGKFVVANDLRCLFPVAGDFDTNFIHGRVLTILAYAKQGLAHAFVGNSCPGFYKCPGDSFKIANEPYNCGEDDHDCDGYDHTEATTFEGRLVASICTDLWWYSVCDHAEYTRRLQKYATEDEIEYINSGVKIVDTKPGVYRFTYDNESYYDADGVVYTTIEWVRDPDPISVVEAAVEAREELEVSAHAFVQKQAVRWPTLFGKADSLDERRTVVPWSALGQKDRVHSWQRVANHLFYINGGGTGWSERGFPVTAEGVDHDLPDIDPPSFRAQYRWYPFSNGYGGLFSGDIKKFSPSFAKLAFRSLESIVSFGTTVNTDFEVRFVPQTRERMLLAVERLRLLTQEYPEFADPQYVEWLSQEGRAESWVASFPLGPEKSSGMSREKMRSLTESIRKKTVNPDTSK